MKCRARFYSNQELALAYELLNEGWHWKRICQGLGGSPGTLLKAIRRAERDGLKR